MIFQEPMTSVNPVYTIGFQITEAVMQHRAMTTMKHMKETIKVLEHVGIPAPRMRFV
jgi:ABC-type microcin C transport system duplicated ATPase subunit YejF